MTREEKAAYDHANKDRFMARKLAWDRSPRGRRVRGEAAKQRKSRAKHWLTILLANARYRAAKSGAEFTIEASDIQVVEVCPVLGIPLRMGVQTGPCDRASRESSPSLDRVDNSRGYVPGNVRLISWRANRIKADANLAEIEAIAAYMRGEI